MPPSPVELAVPPDSTHEVLPAILNVRLESSNAHPTTTGAPSVTMGP